jgi:hypothetical protein
MPGFGGGAGSETSFVRAESTKGMATMANGSRPYDLDGFVPLPLLRIAFALVPPWETQQRIRDDADGNRENDHHHNTSYDGLIEIARARGDCELRAFTTSALNNAALGSRRFTNARV